MAINFDTALGVHPLALMLRSRRAEMLASNLANADTPNYKATDVDFRKVLTAAVQNDKQGVSVARTHAGHLGGGATSIGSPETLYRVPSQSSVDGNTVDTQMEHAEFMRNALQYQTSLQFVSSKIRGLMTAIRGD
jgi:flagellar basal-body rod protein FlgB